MSFAYLSLVLDVMVLLGLAATIYYALILSRSLNAFRQCRQEFGNLLAELSRNIEKAQAAVAAMKTAGTESGSNLQEVIEEARMMADELQLINEAGNNLAKRLEGLAQRSSQTSPAYEDPDDPGAFEKDYYTAPSPLAAVKSSGFSIQDRDFEDTSSSGAGEFKSRAERELFEALQKGKPARKGMM